MTMTELLTNPPPSASVSAFGPHLRLLSALFTSPHLNLHLSLPPIKINIPFILYKRCQPTALLFAVRQLIVELGVCLSGDVIVYGLSTGDPLIGVVEPIPSQSMDSPLQWLYKCTHLNSSSLYVLEAISIQCAVACLPVPLETRNAMGSILVRLPVKMKALGTSRGSVRQPLIAS